MVFKAFSLFAVIFLVILNIILPRLLRSSRGGSDQRCRQSMTLSGLNLSPWSSPANSPLRLSLRLLHKNHRIPLSPPTPCGSVSTSKQNSKKIQSQNNLVKSGGWTASSQPEVFAPLLSNICLNESGSFSWEHKLYTWFELLKSSFVPQLKMNFSLR